MRTGLVDAGEFGRAVIPKLCGKRRSRPSRLGRWGRWQREDLVVVVLLKLSFGLAGGGRGPAAPIISRARAAKRRSAARQHSGSVNKRTGFEIGAGWHRISQRSGEEYLSVKLEAPEIGVIFGNLAPAPGGKENKKVILWNNPQ